jgi:hypothetical protein
MVKSNPTYSIGTTALRERNPFTTATVILPDTDADGNTCAQSFTALQMVMRAGNQVLVKKPDGALAWCTIDAERSRPNLIYVRRVS